ncbi:MAG: Lytic transglycosylase, catalytic [Bryobacterales bacterium]|nr:Lytic transglycosylase, catalytic [Bryobacterales bacterium]
MTDCWARIFRAASLKIASGCLAGAVTCAAATGPNPALNELSLGMKAFALQDYTGTITHLKVAQPNLPKLGDYVAYYLGASKAQLNDYPGVVRELEAMRLFASPISPLAAKATLLEAQARLQIQDVSGAIRVLRNDFDALPQPDGAMALAQAYEAQGEKAQAATLYQRVYFEYPATQTAAMAWTAIDRLSKAMGADYPPPGPKEMLERGSQWLAAKEYEKAKEEFQALSSRLTGPERDEASVRVGLAEFQMGNYHGARQHLAKLKLARSEADAERMYYLAECARKLNDDAEMVATVQSLGKLYPKSVWRLKALVSTGNRFLYSHEADKYDPLYKAAYETFPDDSSTAYCHWKITWDAYLKRSPEAEPLLREQVKRYPADSKAASALYFLARLAETSGDRRSARAYYDELAAMFPNYYYGVLAFQKLAQPGIAAAAPMPAVTQWLNTVAFPERPDLSNEAPTAATKARIERAQMLTDAGFPDWALLELRFGADTDGQKHLLAIQIARNDDTTAHSLRHMKLLAPEYLSLPFDHAPREFWQYLFPLPYREPLVKSAQAQNLDPYLVAGLIRQESEFNPAVISHANAYGLMQLIPSTGRMMAGRQGIGAFRTSMLLEPNTSLRLGSTYLRIQIDKWHGNLEQTLAAYNAGPGRVQEWMASATYREPAEFVESIPFNETREYVQAVLRNAFIYRRLYDSKSKPVPPVLTAAAVPSTKRSVAVHNIAAHSVAAKTPVKHAPIRRTAVTSRKKRTRAVS